MDLFPKHTHKKNQQQKQALQKVACEDWSERCSDSRVKAPKGRKDFEFEKKSAKDIEMEELMETLQASGMGGMGGGMGAFYM